MQYKPYWQRIFFLAVLLHFFILSAVDFFGFKIISPPEENNFEKFDWIEIEVEDLPSVEELTVETAEVVESDFDFPQIEMPPLPEFPAEKNFPPPPVEKISEHKQEIKADKSDAEENKLKVISKIFPKDIFGTLSAAGFKTRPTLASGKVIIELKINVKGTVSNAKVISNDAEENKNAVKMVSEMAASAWTFEPVRDAEGNLQEITTQIEFTPTDF